MRLLYIVVYCRNPNINVLRYTCTRDDDIISVRILTNFKHFSIVKQIKPVLFLDCLYTEDNINNNNKKKLSFVLINANF